MANKIDLRWRPWFAWHPIKANDKFVWLRWVERKMEKPDSVILTYRFLKDRLSPDNKRNARLLFIEECECDICDTVTTCAIFDCLAVSHATVHICKRCLKEAARITRHTF